MKQKKESKEDADKRQWLENLHFISLTKDVNRELEKKKDLASRVDKLNEHKQKKGS